MTDIIFKPLIKFNDKISVFESNFSGNRRYAYIRKILNELKTVNEKKSSLRKHVTDCYQKIIPLGFKLFRLSPQMANQMEKNFDQWTAIPHFNKYEVDLVESYYTRDHYLHPLCVFATGVYVLSHLYKTKVLSLGKIAMIIPSWLFCALLHDLGYVIERYSNIVDVFFSKFLMVQYSATFNFKDVMFNGHYSKNIRDFNDELTKFLNKCQNKNSFTRHEIESIVNNTLYEENDHGLISALSAYERLDSVIANFNDLILDAELLRKAPVANKKLIENLNNRWNDDVKYNKFKKAYFRDNYFKYIEKQESSLLIRKICDDFIDIKRRFKKIVLAIGIHNKLINKFYQNGFNGKIHFQKTPLVFLLLYCDAIQDWGRSKQQDNEIELNIIKYDSSVKQLVAKYKKPECDKDKIRGKIAELDKISKYLKTGGYFDLQIIIPPYRPVKIK